MSQNRTNRLAVLARTCCVVGACALWFGSAADVNAGVIVASEAMIGAETTGSQTPAVPQPAEPLVRDLDFASLLNSTTSNTGAGSHSPTFGPSTGLVAVVSEALPTSTNQLISRLSLFSRIAIPSPLEDRFFRPPRGPTV